MTLVALVYVALAAAAAALLTGRAGFWVRLPLVVCLPVVAFAVWSAAQPPTGWPASAAPPVRAEFQWAFIREPDIVTHDPGEIDLWLTPPGDARPRAYRMPYTRALHRQAQAAMAAEKQGVRVGVARPSGRRRGDSQGRGRVVFYVLPPPHVEAKN